MNGTHFPYHMDGLEFAWLMLQGLVIGCFWTSMVVVVPAAVLAFSEWARSAWLRWRGRVHGGDAVRLR